MLRIITIAFLLTSCGQSDISHNIHSEIQNKQARYQVVVTELEEILQPYPRWFFNVDQNEYLIAEYTQAKKLSETAVGSKLQEALKDLEHLEPAYSQLSKLAEEYELIATQVETLKEERESLSAEISLLSDTLNKIQNK